MNSELFIDILVECFEFVGLTPVKRSPIRLEVLDAYGNARVGEVFFLSMILLMGWCTFIAVNMGTCLMG